MAEEPARSSVDNAATLTPDERALALTLAQAFAAVLRGAKAPFRQEVLRRTAWIVGAVDNGTEPN